MRRTVGSSDNLFAHEQLAKIKKGGESVLATGRFATHLVGASDLETVGQFFERREALSQMNPSQPPLKRYQFIILDRLENFQQRREQTAQIERESVAIGFRITADQYDIVVLQRD